MIQTEKLTSNLRYSIALEVLCPSKRNFFGGGLKSMPSVTKETEAHLKSNSQFNPASMAEIVFFP